MRDRGDHLIVGFVMEDGQPRLSGSYEVVRELGAAMPDTSTARQVGLGLQGPRTHDRVDRRVGQGVEIHPARMEPRRRLLVMEQLELDDVADDDLVGDQQFVKALAQPGRRAGLTALDPSAGIRQVRQIRYLLSSALRAKPASRSFGTPRRRHESSAMISAVAEDDFRARVERAFDRNTAAFDRNTDAFERNTDAFERNLAAFDRNTGAFERNSAVLDATLERLDRSEEDHRLFMREMILRFEKSDDRMRREWTAFRREMAEDRHVHDQAVLSILDRLERLKPDGGTAENA